MKKAQYVLFSLMTIFTLIFGALAISPAQAVSQPGPAPLYLKSGAFVPQRGYAAPAAIGRNNYFIVQFSGPVEQAWREALTASGLEVLEYIPDFAFKVRGPAVAAKSVSQLSFVTSVLPFRPEFKFRAGLVTDSQPRLYRVRLERGSDLPMSLTALQATGVEMLGQEGDILWVAASGALLNSIAQIADVASIDEFTLNQITAASSGAARNDVGAGSIIGAATANTRGYDGSTQIVAVADTGLGGGTSATAHRDIPSSRIVSIFNWVGTAGGCFSTITNDGAIDVDSGHGTHTTGSVLSGGAPNGIGRGSAPAARLVFQATENWVKVSNICKSLYGYTDGYYLTGLPSDLNTLYQQAYDAGARVHSNSWGSAQAGKYTLESVQTDTFMWNHKDMLITFSAGNEGTDANSDGVIDNDSMGAPATAKNVLTVGASENQRPDNFPCDTSLTYTQCAAQGGVNSIFTWGAAWPSDYPANPIFGDSSANNSGQMAAFSSRGPTDDGRIKPDVVAPGSWILSTYSNLYQQGYDASPNPQNNAWQYDGYGFPYDAYYKYLSGTSMSNPITAGGAAVIKDYYQKVYGINASAALVKATLINTAVDMLDENNDGVNDNDYPIPNSHEGWGRINLDAATNGSVQYVENAGLTTNGTVSYTVTPTGGPLKVTVVWSDYPSTETATVNLVNDLDLTVSGAATFLGNVFSGGWSVSGGTADRRNNVENVYVQNPSGSYTITVKGYNVPSGPQPFALVVTGGSFGSAPTPTTGPTSTPTNTAVPPTSTPLPGPTNTPLPPTATPVGPASTGYKFPSANAAVTSSSGDNNGYQTNPANAYANDSLFAVDTNSGTGTSTSYTATTKDRHVFSNFNLNVPTGATIQGIQVSLDAKVDSTTGSPKIYVQFSWDGGLTWTTALATPTLSKTEKTYALGGTTNTWGRTWNAADFSNTNFRLRVIDVAKNTARDFSLDVISVNVTYLP